MVKVRSLETEVGKRENICYPGLNFDEAEDEGDR